MQLCGVIIALLHQTVLAVGDEHLELFLNMKFRF